MKVLITGASGHLGRRVAHKLAQSGLSLRLMVRNKAQAPKIPGAEIVTADFGDTESLRRAFEGIERAFIVSLHQRPMERAELHRNAFNAAANAGVSFLVYTSFQGAAQNATFSMARDHFRSEQYLQESGVKYAALRNSFYMDDAHREVNEDGMILSPAGNGRIAWVCRDDIAELAAHLLQNPLAESEAFDVTGPEALSLSGLAELLSELTDRSIKYGEESYDKGLAWRGGYGLVDWDLDAWMTSAMAKGEGANAHVSETIDRFLRRKPRSLSEFYASYPKIISALK